MKPVEWMVQDPPPADGEKDMMIRRDRDAEGGKEVVI